MQPAPSAGKRCEEITIGFSLAAQLVEKVARVFANQSQRLNQNQSKRELLSTQLKTALTIKTVLNHFIMHGLSIPLLLFLSTSGIAAERPSSSPYKPDLTK